MSYGTARRGRSTGCSSASKCSRWEALRATVSPATVLLAAPAHRQGARVLKGRQQLAGEAVIADCGYGALNAPLVARMAHACRIDVKAARLGIFEEGRRDARGQRIRRRDDGARGIWNKDLEDAPEQGPRRLARFNGAGRRLLERRIDEPIARADGGEDPRPKSPLLAGKRQPADPARVDLQLLPRGAIHDGNRRCRAAEIELDDDEAMERGVGDHHTLAGEQLPNLG